MGKYINTATVIPTTKDISIGVLASLAMRLIIVLVGQDGNRFRNTTRFKALVSLCI